MDTWGRSIVGVVCDPTLSLRPLAEVVRDRADRLVLIPGECEAAIEKIEELTPDVVVVQEAEGFEFLRALRAGLGHCPRLFWVTDDPAALTGEERALVDGVVEAPLSSRSLSQIIDLPSIPPVDPGHSASKH